MDSLIRPLDLGFHDFKGGRNIRCGESTPCVSCATVSGKPLSDNTVVGTRGQGGQGQAPAAKHLPSTQNTILQANAAWVQTLSDEAARAGAAIDSSLKNLEDIQATLNTITQAVKRVLAVVKAG